MRKLMNAALLAALALVVLAAPPAARAGVVINEIFYNAPDDLDAVQWIELHNSGEAAVDIGGWTLDEGKLYTFPKDTRIEAGGFLVVALNVEQFGKAYGNAKAVGPLKRPLQRNGERIALKDAQGKPIDNARYNDGAPVSADGFSASVERITPGASGEAAENWAGSPLPPTPRPAGTPGQRNANYSAELPPAVSVGRAPADLTPDQPLRVEAQLKDKAAASEVSLLYRVMSGGEERQEQAVAMTTEGSGLYVGSIPPQQAGSLIRYRVKAVAPSGAQRLSPAAHDLRPTFSAYVHEKWEAAKLPFALIIQGGADRPKEDDRPQPPRPQARGRGPRPNIGGFGVGAMAPPRPPRGASALVYFDPKESRTAVFDYISAGSRNNSRGYEVFLHKDRPLNRMTAFNIVYEGSEWSLLAEAMAYDLYRRAGSPAPLTEFVRVWVDGKPQGHHLLVERPNKSFLRRNKIDDSGNLYKLLWYGRGVVGQHEKRTNTQSGHEDLLAVFEQLQKTRGKSDEQWKVIQDHFDVDQVAAYFAVNTLLSHWDGFFNNYFAYHDPKRDKWMMFPWDQDKTSGYYDGLPDDQVFFEMPLTFGMEGDRPPGALGGLIGGGGANVWWRPAGHFSGPLLANPHFRKVFLAKTRELLDKTVTAEVYGPVLDAMAERLAEDAKLRAAARGEPPEAGTKLLARDVGLLKLHLEKRREFLLKQKELVAAAEGEARGEPKP